jgi:hypothetical protein
LPNNGLDLLLKFIKRLLPSNNKIPQSYHTLKQDFNEYRFQKFKVCVSCGEKVMSENCTNFILADYIQKQVDALIFYLKRS